MTLNTTYGGQLKTRFFRKEMKMEKLNKNNHATLARFYKGKKVLVAGGAGFVGTNLVLKLKELDAKITATYHRHKPQIEDSTVHYIKADLTQAEDCKKAVKGRDY